MSKTVCVIGASGLLGRYLCQEFEGGYSLIRTCHRISRQGFYSLDITVPQEIQSFFSDHSAEIVLFAAAMTHVDLCEEEKERCFKTNVSAVRNAIQALQKKGKPYTFVFFSSEYIFDGAGGPYRDSDQPNPISVYGLSKLKAEEIIEQEVKDYLIIRATGIYGVEAEGKNFFYTVRRFLTQNHSLTVPSDQISTPTYAKHIAQAVRLLVEKGQKGIFHAADGTLVSRADFAKVIAQRFGWHQEWIRPAPTPQLNQKAKRPLKGGLVPSAILEREQGIHSLQESLDEFYEEWSKNNL